jgi:stage II sporulation protein D
VWGVPPIPYLTPMTDALPAGRVHHEWTFSVANDALLSSLNADARTRVGRTLRDVDITTRDSSGRAAHVTIGGETPRAVRGEELRSIVNQRFGERAIQSTRFTVQRSGRTYVFRGTGYGHGVGLCQLGAAVRARRGESAAQILSAYFKGATLTRTRA